MHYKCLPMTISNWQHNAHLSMHDIMAVEPRDLTHTLAQLRIKYS